MASDYYAQRTVESTHLVKGEDLNHHHTLYGGRCVEWCVHAAYIAAEACFDTPTPLVFMSIRSLSMRRPARLGDIVRFRGTIDYVGESTIGVRVNATLLQPREEEALVATGTFLFCTVDEAGRSVAHQLPAVTDGAAETRWKSIIREASPSLR